MSCVGTDTRLDRRRTSTDVHLGKKRRFRQGDRQSLQCRSRFHPEAISKVLIRRRASESNSWENTPLLVQPEVSLPEGTEEPAGKGSFFLPRGRA